MNGHLNSGELRAALDGELDPQKLAHFRNCSLCQKRSEAIAIQARQTTGRLSFLPPSAGQAAPPAEAALRHFHRQTQYRKENTMFKKLFASPLLRVGLAVVLMLAIVLSFPQARALAGQLLGLFRVQQVVVVPVDFSGMQQLTGNSQLSSQISNLVSSSVDMTQKPGAPVNAADAAQASQMTGFAVRTPQGLAPSRITVQNAAAFTFKVDRAKAQALLNEAGRSDLVLPESIDGADVAVNIPASVSVAYGTCPDPSTQDNSFSLGGGSNGRRYPDCVMLAEIPSPTVSAPAGLDVSQLAQIALQFSGMTSEQAAAFTKTVDWTSSLVIPIPKNAATYDQVTVDGVTGTLIQRPADDAPQFALIWVKNGIIYAIGGLGSNSQQALQMANSLP